MKFYFLPKLLKSTFLSLLFLSACNTKPVACLFTSDGNTVKVNQDITVTSCSRDADAYEWSVEGGGETILEGGNNCDKFIKIKFSSAGEKKVKLKALKFKKKSKSTCQSMGNDAKTDENFYNIIVE